MLKKISIKELLNKAIRLLTFMDLSIRAKFILFSTGLLFWLVIIAAIGLISLFEMKAKSDVLINTINPQERTANIAIRKLRGASISAHKITLIKESERINDQYIKGMGRVEDVRTYLNILLTGGNIKDHSRGTGQVFDNFNVLPLQDIKQRKLVEDIISKTDRLGMLMDEIARIKSAGRIKDIELLHKKLSEYDVLTSDAVTTLIEYSISTNKEYQKISQIILSRLPISVTLIAVAFVFATILSVVFSILIPRSMARPIGSIIGQINALSSGELSFTKKLEVASKDEVGILSSEFNRFLDTIGRVTSFKKVIEEDETTEDIYLRLGNICSDELGLEGCVIYEVSNSKNNMKIVYPPEADDLELHCKREILLDSDLCRAKRTGHIVSSIEYQSICKYFAGTGKQEHICVPIIIGGNVGGVMQFVCGKAEKCDIVGIEKKISKAHQYVRETQPVLESKRLMKTLKESAVKDTLTGFYNRRFLEEISEGLIAGILRRGTTLGILMCDLDYFKQVNDTYGHDVGDAVLKETASVIQKSIRASDVAIRFGGEEFMVLLVDIKPGYYAEAAEKIRARIEETKVKIAGGFIQKTISIGASEFPNDTQNFWECIKYADVALYKAKERGRNRVLRFTPDMWTEEKY